MKDTSGEPVIGASVVEKGNTTNGTITDLDALLNDLLAEVHAGDIVVLAGSLPKGAPPVSYTHLDVYKRQVHR